MRPRRTHDSNRVLTLGGGNEDNDLWATEHTFQAPGDPSHGMPCISTAWEFTDEERAQIAAGANIALTVVGAAHPPVSMCTIEIPLGKAPDVSAEEDEAG